MAVAKMSTANSFIKYKSIFNYFFLLLMRKGIVQNFGFEFPSKCPTFGGPVSH